MGYRQHAHEIAHRRGEGADFQLPFCQLSAMAPQRPVDFQAAGCQPPAGPAGVGPEAGVENAADGSAVAGRL